jgi:hypothetical protein
MGFSLDSPRTPDARRPRNLAQTIEHLDRLLGIVGKVGQGLRLGALSGAVDLPKETAQPVIPICAPSVRVTLAVAEVHVKPLKMETAVNLSRQPGYP